MEDGSSPGLGFVIFLILIAIEFIFYGFGTAIQQLNEHQIEQKAEAKDKKSIILLQLIRKPLAYINTLQTISVLTGIIIGLFEIHNLSGILAEWLGSRVGIGSAAGAISAAAVILLITYLIVTIGIFVPKKIAGKHPEKWAYKLVYLMYAMTALFRPFTWLIGRTAHLILKFFGIDSQAIDDDVTEEEIISMVNEGYEQGVLEDDEVEMIHNIIEFGGKEASDIMTRRKHVIALNGMDTLDEALEFILKQNYSRFPVYDDNIDNILGVLHLRDAMKYHRDEAYRKMPVKMIPGLVRSVSFIPETRNIDQLFRTMQSQKMHMAIVVDEYGQTAGLVAMEDILEEIVGNIWDEYDVEENYIIRQEDGSLLVKGMTPLEELEEVIELEFEEDEFDTLNGFLISVLDRIPNEGEVIEIRHKAYLFQVLAVENKMIQKVRIISQNNMAAEQPEQTIQEHTEIVDS